MEKINIQEEIKKVSSENYLINCHYGEEDSTVHEIIKLIEDKCEFPDEDRIEGSHDCIHDDGVPVDFDYKGENVSGLVIGLLIKFGYDMVEFNDLYEEQDFRKQDIAYIKESTYNKMLE